MLIVEQRGKEKLETFGDTLEFFVMSSKEKGRAALEDLVKNAMDRALETSLNRFFVEILFFHKSRGRMTTA